VTATLVDDAGTRIPDSTTVIHFSTSGPASIVAVDNGNLMDLDPFQATQRKVYYGNAVALVRATGSEGKVTVTASADGIQPATLTLNTAPVEKEDPNLAMPASSARSF
jgi:beta-galactosidase